MARRPTLDETASRPSNAALLRAALEEGVGAAIVLGPELQIVGATPRAHLLVGAQLVPGELATRALCGDSEQRPLAEALAAGRPVSAQVVRPGPDGERVLAVRAVPMFAAAGEPPSGFLLMLDEVGFAAGSEGRVELHGILTADPAMKRLLRDVGRVARSAASVLVRGETGSGKELVAQAIHHESARAKGPFRAINCAALPAPLLESELFGHVRGAFTGAVRDDPGHIRLAHGGTLFLDEVAELPLELQAKLLRVLQERTVLPVGGREPIPVDVRFVAATHRSLRAEVEAGRFRADLMYRLRVVPLFLPPLRARPLDIPLLTDHFVERLGAVSERRIEHVSGGALAAMAAYEWPGNVRELANAIEYALVMGEGPVLTQADLPPEVRGEESAAPLVNAGEPAPVDLTPEARRILRALERAGGSRERAAKVLGMSRVTLWRRLRALGLEERQVDAGVAPAPDEP